MNFWAQWVHFQGLSLEKWSFDLDWLTLAVVVGLVVGEITHRLMAYWPLQMLKGWHAEAIDMLGEPPEKHILEKSEVFKTFFPELVGYNKNFVNRSLKGFFTKKKIFWWVLSASLFLVTAARFGVEHGGWLAWIFVSLGLVLSGVDFKAKLLPDPLIYVLLWLGILINSSPLAFVSLNDACWAAVVSYSGLWIFYHIYKLLTGKEGMGFGDFKLLAAMSAWFGLASILPILILSCVVGAVIGIIGIATKVLSRETTIPFGPYLLGAGWLWLILVWAPGIYHAPHLG